MSDKNVAVQNTVKTDWSSIDTDVQYSGTSISLPGDPENMPLKDAIATLQRIQKDESQEYDVNELISGAPWDALVAITRALKEIYGVVLAQSKMTFFGEIKPDLVTVKVDAHGGNIQVPMGAMQLPNLKNRVEVGLHPRGLGAYIASSVNKKDRLALVRIATLARKYLSTDSIYKGKAIRLGVDDDGDLVVHQQPEFLDLTKVQEGDMIHTVDTTRMIQNNIFAPLKHTKECRTHHIPLKRGILLEGRYGTGKSLTARVTAKVANENGWTFVMLDRAQGLKAAIEFAKNYQPCVVFAEDIDRAADRSEEAVNDLVNMLDGLISKDMELMTVLTTNHIDKIDQALLRPGRFDAIISILAPDPEAVVRLVRHYGRELLDPGAELSKVGELVAGQIPATIREVVERAKLQMLIEGRKAISADDLYYAAYGMQSHWERLAPKEIVKSAGDRMLEALVEGLFGVEKAEADLTAVKDGVEKVRKDVRAYGQAALERITKTTEIAKGAANSALEGKELISKNLKVTSEVRDIVS